MKCAEEKGGKKEVGATWMWAQTQVRKTGTRESGSQSGGLTGANRWVTLPDRPWRRNLRFLRPKMRTLEKISTRLPLQSPRFLLGLLRLLLADGRSQCCSRAWRFWRIKPLAIAAAMVTPKRVRAPAGPEVRGAGERARESEVGVPEPEAQGVQAAASKAPWTDQSHLGPIIASPSAGPGAQMRPGRNWHSLAS